MIPYIFLFQTSPSIPTNGHSHGCSPEVESESLSELFPESVDKSVEDGWVRLQITGKK